MLKLTRLLFPEDTEPVGYEAMTMFDENWLDVLQTALQGAKKREIVCDMIVGSGWPFGGEFLKKDEQTQMVTIETIDLNGSKQYKLQYKRFARYGQT